MDKKLLWAWVVGWGSLMGIHMQHRNTKVCLPMPGFYCCLPCCCRCTQNEWMRPRLSLCSLSHYSCPRCRHRSPNRHRQSSVHSASRLARRSIGRPGDEQQSELVPHLEARRHQRPVLQYRIRTIRIGHYWVRPSLFFNVMWPSLQMLPRSSQHPLRGGWGRNAAHRDRNRAYGEVEVQWSGRIRTGPLLEVSHGAGSLMP